MDKAKLESASFTFIQDGNGLGTTDTMEQLTIECNSDFGIDESEGCFYVLKTETGWSIDDVKELEELINRCNSVILNNKNNDKRTND
jgi:hypothetical protein